MRVDLCRPANESRPVGRHGISGSRVEQGQIGSEKWARSGELAYLNALLRSNPTEQVHVGYVIFCWHGSSK